MSRSSPSNCSVTHCAAVVMSSPDDPTMIILRQELLCADDIECAVDAAKESAMEDNPGWIVQCASALYLSPNTKTQATTAKDFRKQKATDIDIFDPWLPKLK